MALGKINDTRAVEPLIQALKDQNSEVRSEARVALTELGWRQAPLAAESWEKTLDGSGYDNAASVRQTSDGGYVIVGKTYSYSNDDDVWLIKTDTLGNKLWDKTFGGSGKDEANSVQQTSDGGYIIAGSTNSSGAGHNVAWLIKTDSDGNKQWDRAFSGSGNDYAIQFSRRRMADTYFQAPPILLPG